jgi:hypothetical protein
MNDQSSGWSPDFNDDDDGDGRPLRSDVEKTLMDRARRAAERDREKGPRRYLQHAVALAVALVVVTIFALGFDAFLTAMQKILRATDGSDARPQATQPAKAPDPTEPMPAYVVPDD